MSYLEKDLPSTRLVHVYMKGFPRFYSIILFPYHEVVRWYRSKNSRQLKQDSTFLLILQSAWSSRSRPAHSSVYFLKCSAPGGQNFGINPMTLKATKRFTQSSWCEQTIRSTIKIILILRMVWKTFHLMAWTEPKSLLVSVCKRLGQSVYRIFYMKERTYIK